MIYDDFPAIFRALLAGKKIGMLGDHETSYWKIWSNGDLYRCVDDIATRLNVRDFMNCLLNSAIVVLEDDPKPELKITPDDVGKRVRLRNGDVAVILAWIGADKEFPVRSMFANYTASGRYLHVDNGQVDMLDIVEVLR